MNLGLTEEQRMLLESADRLAERFRSSNSRETARQDKLRVGGNLWREMADQGWLGIGIAPEFGGLGGGPVEIMIVMEALGRRLVRSPFLSSVVVGGQLLTVAGNDAQRKSFLPTMVAGKQLVALAASEPPGRALLERVSTTTTTKGANFVLQGLKTVVLDGATADSFIVLARSSGRPGDTEGLSLFLVPRNAPGLEVKGYHTYDDRPVANVALNGVQVGRDALLGVAGEAYSNLEFVIDYATAALCAEAVGAMTAAYDMTLEYVKIRRQFGKPIGSFQVIQHRLVDLFVAIEECKSLSLAASMHLAGEAGLRRRMVSAAKTWVGSAGRTVGEECAQIHGAIGMTDEHDISAYFKSLAAIDTIFGDGDHHLGRFSQLSN